MAVCCGHTQLQRLRPVSGCCVLCCCLGEWFRALIFGLLLLFLNCYILVDGNVIVVHKFNLGQVGSFSMPLQTRFMKGVPFNLKMVAMGANLV